MINFLARRPNPTPYMGYKPDTITAFGEARMLGALRRDAPAFIVVVSAEAAEYGAQSFGVDYARATAWWIAENYDPVAIVGAPPYESDAFGMALLRRKR